MHGTRQVIVFPFQKNTFYLKLKENILNRNVRFNYEVHEQPLITVASTNNKKTTIKPVKVDTKPLVCVEATDVVVDFCVQSANQFESIRYERPVIHDSVIKMHCIIVEGIILGTPDLGLDYPGLMQLIDRGLATGASPKALELHDVAGRHDRCIVTSQRAWNRAGEHYAIQFGVKFRDFLQPNWLLETDFFNESDYVKATQSGYFTKEDFDAGNKQGFANGPVYYFGREENLKPHEAEKALFMGIPNARMYRYVIKGKFTDIATAEAAYSKGFSTKKQYEEARTLGCETKDQYDAIKKHKWDDLATFKFAEKMGFEPTESLLYKSILDTPHYSLYKNEIWNDNCEECLELVRDSSDLIDFQHEAGYSSLWMARILDLLRSAPGKSASYASITECATQSHPFESVTKAIVQDFLINDDQVNGLGRAIPRDKTFKFEANRKREKPIAN